MSMFSRLFGLGSRDQGRPEGNPLPAGPSSQQVANPPRVAPPPTSAPVKPPEMASVSSGQASELREGILAKHTLTKCCEGAPVEIDETTLKVLKEIGLGQTADTGLLRIVLYRLDGAPIPEDKLDKIIISFIQGRATRDGRYAAVLNQYLQAAGFHCPRVGFSIHLQGSKEEIIAQCEVLATTEYAAPGASFSTAGHGFTADGAPYRVYSYWKA